MNAPELVMLPVALSVPTRGELLPTEPVELALYWASRGCRVLTVRTDTKAPDLMAWQKRATTDPQMIRRWWADKPNARVGIATGAPGFDVLDFDVAGGKPGLASRDQLMTEGQMDGWVMQVATPSGGYHYYYAGSETGNSSVGPSGVDYRGKGGMVLAPGNPGYEVVLSFPNQEPEPCDWAGVHATLEATDTVRQASRGTPGTTGADWRVPIPTDVPQRVTGTGTKLSLVAGGLRPGRLVSPRSPFDDEPGRLGPLPDYTRQTDLGGLLEREGWTFHHTDGEGRVHYTRPGKDPRLGPSGNVIVMPDGREVFKNFSSSVDMPTDLAMDAADVYARLHHRGDRSAAARALLALGYGATHTRAPSAPLRTTGTTPEAGAGTVAPPQVVAPVRAALPVPVTGLPGVFWEARPALAHIRDAAYSRQRSAFAVLGGVLARVAALSHHRLRVPPVVGTASCLSYIAAILAPPGVGKSSAAAIATELLPEPVDQRWLIAGEFRPVADGLPVGSGEGLVESLFETVEEPAANGKMTQVRRQVRANAYVNVDEGQVLSELGARQGATLLPTLRTAWSGGALGQANASKERRRIAKAGSYVFGVTVALQPELAGKLLADATGGTPQRFLWTNAIDPDIPTWDRAPKWPGTLPYEPLSLPTGASERPDEPVWFVVADEIRIERLKADHAAATGQTVGGDPFDSHLGLLRLKTACLLALLDGRYEANAEDWHLAGMVVDASRAMRLSVQGDVRAAEDRNEQAATMRAANRASTVEAVAEHERVARVARGLAAKVRDDPDGHTFASLRRAASNKQREVFPEALAHAVASGWVTEVAGDAGARLLRPGDKRP